MKFFIFLITCSAFALGISVGHYKYQPFDTIVKVKSYLISSKKKVNFDKFASCNIKKIPHVLNNSHAFIGHAYGAPSKSKFNSFIAENAYSFITQNKSKLRSITFTGDVFSFPSIDKWKKLSLEISENLQIFVAPGNHDIMRPDSMDIFKQSEFGKQNYPFLKYLDDTPVIFEDSISNGWEVSNKTIELANNKGLEIVIIARHNMPTSDLLEISNSLAGMSPELEAVEELVDKFNKNTLFYWVIGDSGAFQSLPRLSCFTYDNHTFLANGLGEVMGDTILLFNKGKFYQYEVI